MPIRTDFIDDPRVQRAEQQRERASVRAAQKAVSTPKPAAAPTPGTPSSKRAGAVRGAGALAVGLTAPQVAATPTEDYYTRFGVDASMVNREGIGGLAKDLLVRTAGAGTDVLDNATLGVLSTVAPQLYGDRAAATQAGADVRAAPAAAVAQQQPRAQQPQQPAAAPAGDIGQVSPGVFRNGNSFGEVATPGAQPFAQGRGSVNTQVPAARAGIDSLANQFDQRLERERISAAQFNRGQDRRQAVNDLKKELAKAMPGGKTAQGLQAQIASLSGGDTATPDEVSARVGQARAGAGAEQAKTDLARQQGIGAGLANQQAQRTAEIMQQLEGIGTLSPEQRSSLLDRALVSQGKDPRQKRPDPVALRGGETMQGRDPDQLIYFDEQGNPQVFGGGQGGAVGQPTPSVQYEEGKVYADANGNRIKIVNGQKVPIT